MNSEEHNTRINHGKVLTRSMALGAGLIAAISLFTSIIGKDMWMFSMGVLIGMGFVIGIQRWFA